MSYTEAKWDMSQKVLIPEEADQTLHTAHYALQGALQVDPIPAHILAMCLRAD